MRLARTTPSSSLRMVPPSPTSLSVPARPRVYTAWVLGKFPHLAYLLHRLSTNPTLAPSTTSGGRMSVRTVPLSSRSLAPPMSTAVALSTPRTRSSNSTAAETSLSPTSTPRTTASWSAAAATATETAARATSASRAPLPSTVASFAVSTQTTVTPALLSTLARMMGRAVTCLRGTTMGASRRRLALGRMGSSALLRASLRSAKGLMSTRDGWILPK